MRMRHCCRVRYETDSIESHVSDTFQRRRWVGDPAVVVEFTARNARDSIQWLIQQGSPDQGRMPRGESPLIT